MPSVSVNICLDWRFRWNQYLCRGGGGGGGGRIVYESQAMGNNWTTAEHYAHCVLYCVGDNF